MRSTRRPRRVRPFAVAGRFSLTCRGRDGIENAVQAGSTYALRRISTSGIGCATSLEIRGMAIVSGVSAL